MPSIFDADRHAAERENPQAARAEAASVLAELPAIQEQLPAMREAEVAQREAIREAQQKLAQLIADRERHEQAIDMRRRRAEAVLGRTADPAIDAAVRLLDRQAHLARNKLQTTLAASLVAAGQQVQALRLQNVDAQKAIAKILKPLGLELPSDEPDANKLDRDEELLRKQRQRERVAHA